MNNLVRHVAIVSQSGTISDSEVMQISAALQKQLTRDFSPIWGINATIDAFATLDQVPSDYWSIVIRDDIGQQGAAGVHLDRNGQPYALVQAAAGTPITCSHEMLEMLVDPSGNRMVSSDSIKPGQGRVNYLVEICDPCEDDSFGYMVNGIRLSDFYTPNYFDPVTNPGIRYSYTGAIKEPRAVLTGGYISWIDPTTGQWWQATKSGAELEYHGPYNWKLENGKSWREIIDGNTYEPREKLQGESLSKSKTANKLFFSANMKKSSNTWAKSLTEDIEIVISTSKKQR